MKLTPEIREQLRKKQLSNILRKLGDGKSLTRTEQSILDADGTDSTFADTQEELAAALSVDRRTIVNVIKKYPTRLPGKKRGAESDGRYNIVDWRLLLEQLGISGRGVNNKSNADEDGKPPKAHWDRERARVDYERALFNLDLEKKKHVELDEICVAVGQMLAGFRTAINMLPGSAARWLIGLKDFHAIKSKLESEVDGVLQSLGRCKYLEFQPCEKCAPHFIELGKESIKELQIDVAK